MRHQPYGSGLRLTADTEINQNGCGDGKRIRDCSGYELVRDISLTGYIAKHHPIAGWKPIGSCDSSKGFAATFDGNGFEVTGLRIDRPEESCIGLFGRATGTIRNLGVRASSIIGKDQVGGLVGDGSESTIIQSYAVSGEIHGSRPSVGGLVGHGEESTIIQSYAVSSEVRGNSFAGGLVGTYYESTIIQSYAVSGAVRGDRDVGGLVGRNHEGLSRITQSYAERSSVLIGLRRLPSHFYELRDSTAIRAGTKVAGINSDGTIYCDQDLSGSIEADERRDNNRVWDLGASNDKHPAIRCTAGSLADQRAWWSLSDGKPQLNQARLNARPSDSKSSTDSGPPSSSGDSNSPNDSSHPDDGGAGCIGDGCCPSWYGDALCKEYGLTR